MVRDAYAASVQPQQADDGVDLHSTTANLTQELAQLLAQSIAQGQTGKGPPGPATTGSELANLAALVSASQNQRSVPQSFKDGLSSLSYTRPVPPPPAAAPMAMPPMAVSPMAMPPMAVSPMAMPPMAVSPMAVPSAGSGLMAPPTGGLLVSEPHDEEPMPIPSTWRQPTQGDDERWYRQQLGAAGLGLVAGLIVVVPAVLWLSGLLGGAQTKVVAAREAASEAPPVKVAAVKQVRVRVAAASADPDFSATAPAETVAPPQARAAVAEPAPQPRVAAVPPPPAPRPVEPVPSRADELLAQAKRHIASGDISGARSLLEADETATSAALTFILAETFDPNMLASWQTRGVTANPHKAKALYQRARELGDSRAKQRLDWLTVN